LKQSRWFLDLLIFSSIQLQKIDVQGAPLSVRRIHLKAIENAIMTLQGPFFFFQRLPLAMSEALADDAGAIEKLVFIFLVSHDVEILVTLPN
jgi:hypothetical protein